MNGKGPYERVVFKDGLERLIQVKTAIIKHDNIS